jgi:hypothetical protein
LDLAAFYFGAMTHYIADMAVYCHVAQNNIAPDNADFDTYHSNYEGYVNTRSNSFTNLEEFFQLNSFTFGSKTPYNAAVDLAWNTYKDPNPSASVTRNALWMLNNHFTNWKTTYSTRADDTQDHQTYYNRVEEVLNNAIQANVNAMNNVIGGSTDSGSSSSSSTSSTTEKDLMIASYPIEFIMTFLVGFGYVLFLKMRKRTFIQN